MKRILCLATVTTICLILAITALASDFSKNITVTYKGIKISLDSNELPLKDANGNKVEPFVYEGTTYLPVRAISESLSLNVDWDGDTNTVKLSTRAKEAETTDVEKNSESATSDVEFYPNTKIPMLENITNTGYVEVKTYEGYDTKRSYLYKPDSVTDDVLQKYLALFKNNGVNLYSTRETEDGPTYVFLTEDGYKVVCHFGRFSKAYLEFSDLYFIVGISEY